VRFLETLLQRAEAVESHIHAWLSLDIEVARRQARHALQPAGERRHAAGSIAVDRGYD